MGSAMSGFFPHPTKGTHNENASKAMNVTFIQESCPENGRFSRVCKKFKQRG
jgi:hypothetical protein